MDPYGYDDSDQAAQIAAAMSGIPLRQAALQAKMRRAQGLMGTPTAQGREVGRTYVASSPLEHIASAMTRAMGVRDAQAAENDLGGLADQANQAGAAQARAGQARDNRNYGLSLYDANTRRIAAENRGHGAAGISAPSKQAYADDRAPAPPDVVDFLTSAGVSLPPNPTRAQADWAWRQHFTATNRPPQVISPGGTPMLLPPGSNRARPILGPDNKPIQGPEKTQGEDKMGIGAAWEPTEERKKAGPLTATLHTEVTKRLAAVENLAKHSGEIRKEFSKEGSVITGPKAAKLTALARFIQMNLKEAWNLGVLNGPDMDLVNSVVTNPTEAKNILKDSTNYRRFLDQLDAFESAINSEAVTYAGSNGYVPRANARPGLGQAANPGQSAPATNVDLRKKYGL